MIIARENTRQVTAYNGNITHVKFMCQLKIKTEIRIQGSLLSASV